MKNAKQAAISILSKAQPVAEGFLDTYNQAFPHAPLGKLIQSMRTGQPLEFTPEEMTMYGQGMMGQLEPVHMGAVPNMNGGQTIEQMQAAHKGLDVGTDVANDYGQLKGTIDRLNQAHPELAGAENKIPAGFVLKPPSSAVNTQMPAIPDPRTVVDDGIIPAGRNLLQDRAAKLMQGVKIK